MDKGGRKKGENATNTYNFQKQGLSRKKKKRGGGIKYIVSTGGA